MGAGTILVDTIDGTQGYTFAGTNGNGIQQAVEASWNELGSFSNVSIAAELDPGPLGLISATAYLMTQVGPGTTIANQLAVTAPVSVTGTEFHPTLVNLFSGLNLGPGSYYVVLSAPATGFQSGGWEIGNLGNVPTTGSGITLIDPDSTTGAVEGVAAFPPATAFISSGQILQYRVSGDPVVVSEPPILPVLIVLGLMFVLCISQRESSISISMGQGSPAGSSGGGKV